MENIVEEPKLDERSRGSLIWDMKQISEHYGDVVANLLEHIQEQEDEIRRIKKILKILRVKT